MTSNVSEDFGFESKFADGLAVGTGLFRGGWGGKFDVFHTEFIKSSSDFDFFGRIKECVCKLFSFSLVTVSCVIPIGRNYQGGLDDGKI